MGSPPIPDRSPPRTPSTSTSRPHAFRDRSPPRPHPGIQPAVAPASVPFSPPKRRTGGSFKGKERAMEIGPDEVGFDPHFPRQALPTYRHLQGNNGGAANPLRVIAHVDIDAAYAAMEMARLGIAEDQPMAVQQWNGLIAVNYPARAFGITRHESPAEALKKCPNLKLVHVQTYKNGEAEPGYWEGAKPETHKVSLDMYRKESRKILEVFTEVCPVVEKASIDESFLDLTLPVRRALLARCPSLATPPPGSDLDTPLPSPSSLGITDAEVKWDEICNLIPFAGQKKDKVRRLRPDGTAAPSSSPTKPSASQDAVFPPAGDAGDAEGDGESELDLAAAEAEDTPEPPEPPLTWSDIVLSLGAAIVKETRGAVKERLGYTCSAGIAVNKMLAKLTSAWKKPNAQTVLRHSCIPAFLRPLPFQKIRNLGGKLGNAVKETYEAETVGDLLTLSLPELKAKLGEESGMWLWEIVRGLDYTEVEAKTQVKSMLSSKNFRPYISTYGEVMHWMNILATELHLRLGDARADSPGLWPKTITFTHRSPQFVIRSHQTPFPFTSTPTALYILKHGEKLLRIATASPASGSVPGGIKIGPYSNIQLSFSGLERLEEGQRGIEGFFKAGAVGAMGPKKPGNADEDGVKGKKRAASLQPKQEDDQRDIKKKKRKISPSTRNGLGASRSSTSTCGAPTELVLSSDSSDGGDDGEDRKPDLTPFSSVTTLDPSRPPRVKRPRNLPSFTCSRCNKSIVIPTEAEEGLEKAEWEKGKVQEVLERVEAEHADWHVARDLLEQERKRSGWGLSASSTTSNATSIKSVSGQSTKSGGKTGKKKGKKGDGTLQGFFRPK
ncbi:hypothetical protein JCM11641_005731 [Rhodosporidiobolus odoratus]